MKNIEQALLKIAVMHIRRNALREIDKALLRLEGNGTTETLNFMNSGIIIDLNILKKFALTQTKKRMEKL